MWSQNRKSPSGKAERTASPEGDGIGQSKRGLFEETRKSRGNPVCGLHYRGFGLIEIRQGGEPMYAIVLLLNAAGTAILPAPHLMTLYIISAAWLIGREVNRRRYVKRLSPAVTKFIQELRKKPKGNVSVK